MRVLCTFARPMPKRKLQRFEELENLERIFQFPFTRLPDAEAQRHKWPEVFGNLNPIVLELGCGRGEYTIALAKANPHQNFIGVDIKGARIWRGVKTANEEDIRNAAFLRVHIEWLTRFFMPGTVSDIWITFPDPQPQQSRENRRLTNKRFLAMYREILKADGYLHLKTDNRGFFDFTLEVLSSEPGRLEFVTFDLFENHEEGFRLDIQTTYEQKFRQLGFPIHYLRFCMNRDIPSI